MGFHVSLGECRPYGVTHPLRGRSELSNLVPPCPDRYIQGGERGPVRGGLSVAGLWLAFVKR